jgi:SAM-dependent methyltransferase
MSRPLYFEPLKRSYRNWLRKRNRILPFDLPPPFFYAKDITAVHEYFSGFKDKQAERLSRFSSGLHGNCYLCQQEVDFTVDGPTQGEPVNWRETLTCPKCSLINRWRSCLHVFEAVCEPGADDRVYLTESLSPVCQNLASRFPLLSSSEYLPDAEFGELTLKHEVLIRNEDVTNLAFADASMDIVLCFDVLEHVSNYRTALKEFYRVLGSGGQLILSVPFSYRHQTLVRATLDEDGNVSHLVKPCYHGDPLSDQGVLSYYDFGMELLDEMRELGFHECFLLCFYSEKWGYPNENVVFIARKLKTSLNKSAIVKTVWRRTIYQTKFIGERLGERFRYTIGSIEKRMNRFRYIIGSIKRHMSRLFVLHTTGSNQTIQTSEIPVIDMTGTLKLPDIFHYWSNEYIAPEMSRFGFSDPEEFFFQHAMAFLKESANQKTNILSIGSGDCAFEIRIVERLLQWRLSNFVLECLEINKDKLEKGRRAVEAAGLDEYFLFSCDDSNSWKPFRRYGLVLANQSIHEVYNIESLFDSVKGSLKPDGLFIIFDMIGRNSDMRWPEAVDALNPFWDELPDSYRYNRVLNRQEEKFVNHDASIGQLGGMRSQDILPLLMERFNFNFFFPYGNIIFVFIDRAFGHNFDAGTDWDRDFIARVQTRDEAGILSGELKPTSMLAVLTKEENDMTLRHPALTPRHCVRKTPIVSASAYKKSRR